MKKILITVLFLLIATGAGAEFFGSGEFGYSPEEEDFYTELELGYRFHPWILQLELYGGIEVLMDKSRSVFFSPYRDIYTAGGILQCRFLYLTIEHRCIHSVYSNKEQFEENHIPGSGRTRFGIGFEF